MVLSAHLPRSAPLLAGVALVLAGLLVGACDLMTGSPLGVDESKPSVPDSATLAHAHMPTGTSLPSPEEIPLKNGTVQAYEMSQRSPEGVPAKSDSSGADSSGVESPYGCYLASRPYTDAVRFRSVYLYFPESMVQAAGNETERVTLSIRAASVVDSAAAASNPAEAMEQREKTGVRYASCVLPAASGAESLANEQLLRTGEKKAALNAVKSSGDPAPKNQVCVIQEVTTCAGWSWNQSCGTEHEIACSSMAPGEGGDGVGGPGGGGDGTGGYPGGGSGPDGDDGNGDGSNTDDCDRNPEPGLGTEPCDPCESDDPPSYCDSDVNENEVCSNDPLKDMDIRSTCDGIEGGRFGEDARGDGEPHWGIDLLADVGTKVTARGGGVVWSKNQNDTFGRYIIVQSEDGGTFTMYTHLSSRSVEGGDSVVTGETEIGETGTSGNACDTSCSCGPAHLHLEMRQGGDGWGDSTPVDPENHFGTEFEDSTGQPTSDSC